MPTPTVLGSPRPAAAVAQSSVPKSLPSEMMALTKTSELNTGKITLTEAQLSLAEQALAKLDFNTIHSGDIVRLGFTAERALHQNLDDFLARLNKDSAGRLFDLFGKLESGVNDAKLPTLLTEFKSIDKPGAWKRFLNNFRTRKSIQNAAQAAYQSACGVLTGKTKTLQTVMSGLEGELNAEMQKLFGELTALDRLKLSYSTHIDNFALEAAVAMAFLAQAKAIVEAKRSELGSNPDARGQANLQEMQNKLELLESRALALEGAFTALPANQVVIQQIENAGVATLQETATTASNRFGSIKMTLLALHGAVSVKMVQQLNQKNATLDAQLNTLRGQLVTDIVTTAANAPGNNRLDQAKQIERIIVETKAVRAIVEQARIDNAEKFAEARAKFAEARKALAENSSAS